MTTVEQRVSVQDLIRGFIKDDDEPRDPHEVAEEILRSLSEDVLRDLLAQLLPREISRLNNIGRNSARLHLRRHGSPKWERAAHDRAVINFLRSAVVVCGTRKAVADCDMKDCVDIAIDYRFQSDRALRLEREWKLFGLLLQKRGAKRVGDLPHADIAKILGEEPEDA